jgi:hypothetical protein
MPDSLQALNRIADATQSPHVFWIVISYLTTFIAGVGFHRWLSNELITRTNTQRDNALDQVKDLQKKLQDCQTEKNNLIVTHQQEMHQQYTRADTRETQLTGLQQQLEAVRAQLDLVTGSVAEGGREVWHQLQNGVKVYLVSPRPPVQMTFDIHEIGGTWRAQGVSLIVRPRPPASF